MRKPIKDYEGLYEIGEDGSVYSLRKGVILKQNKISGGYYQVGLHKNGVQVNKLVHRLVAEAFIDNPYDLPCINHKDENRQNNHYTNLEWVSYKENNNYGAHNTKLSASLKGRKVKWIERKVAQYDKQGNFIAEYDSIIEAERKTGVKYRSIQQVAAGYPSRHSAGGYVWRYADE